MAYDEIAKFDDLYFGLGSVSSMYKSGTLKSTLGKSFIEKNIPLRNKKDQVLSINGVLLARTQTSSETYTEALERERTELEAFDDGSPRLYADGKNNTYYVIVGGSLSFSDPATRSRNQPIPFKFTLIEWGELVE